jgi:phosphotransferase system HPr-like phosphotransfer protein
MLDLLYSKNPLLYSTGGIFLREFNIFIHSFQEIKEFVSLAMVQPFEVLVGNDKKKINGKSFIGMFSLDFHQPVQVSFKCTDEEYAKFRQDVAHFLA